MSNKPPGAGRGVFCFEAGTRQQAPLTDPHSAYCRRTSTKLHYRTGWSVTE